MTQPFLTQQALLSSPSGASANVNLAAWFGTSRVVDASGAPMVVYHGESRDFAVPKGWFWASDSRLAADTYARWRADFQSEKGEEVAPHVMPVYLRMHNPIEVNAGGDPWHSIYFEGRYIETEDIALIARDRGHDGVIFKNVVDYLGDNDGPDVDSEPLGADFEQTTYVVFEPNQVKSAIGNSGIFDHESHDMTDAHAWVDTADRDPQAPLCTQAARERMRA